MQILHWPFPHPQTGSAFDHSPAASPTSSGSDPSVTEPRSGTPGQGPFAHRYPFLTTLLSPHKKAPTMEATILPPHMNNNTKKEGLYAEFELHPPRPPPPQNVLVTAGDGRRNNPRDDGGRPPGDHYRETDKRVQKRKRESSGAENQEEEDDLVTDGNGYKFEHTDKAYLIVNLYTGERNGYTFTAYLPETVEEEARTFAESHLIPYSETYLLDCINNETLPLRLVATLEREHGIDLVRYRNCVVCEVRDFRRYTSSTSDKVKHHPICRQVVLKPTTETLLTDLEDLISKSYTDRAAYKNECQLSRQSQSPSIEDELIAFKRMRLSNPNYPFDRFEEDRTFVGLDADVEDQDDLTLDQRQELEKRIVRETAGGLCLDPSKQVGIIANCAQFERLKWNSKELSRSLHVYARKKRKLSELPVLPFLVSEDEDETEVENKSKKNEKEGAQVGQEDNAEEVNVDPPPVARIFSQESPKSFRRNATPFLNFINKCVQTKKLKRHIDVEKSQILRLPPIKHTDYSQLPMLTTSLDEIRKLCSQTVEPASIRPLYSDNFITKTEEYVFETERRKHSHKTVVNIFQRNGVDNYFGELEQEALEETNPAETPANSGTLPTRGSTVPVKPFLLDPPTGQPNPGSKCQFELGSSHSVNLYVKQFTDIFTEDGRRPCKITFLKAGQAGPTTLFTSSYKALMNGNNNNSSTTTPSAPPPAPPLNHSTASNVHVGANVVIAHSGAPTPPHNSNTIIVSVPSLPHSGNQAPSTISIPVLNPTGMPQPITTNSPLVPVSSSSSPSQTKSVQIVHPQPRTLPNIQKSTASQLLAAGIQSLTTTSAHTTTTTPVVVNQSSHSTPTNVNLNLHVNSARVVQQRHQLLTRPQIYNVNLTQQQQHQLSVARSSAAATIQQAPQLIQAQPQHHHQQGIRVKQPTLATLLLTGLPTSGGPKPITVAIQPQPQNQGLNYSNQINVNQVQTIQLNSATLDPHHHQLTTPQAQAQQVQIASHHHGGTQTNNQIMIMVSPATGNALTGQNAISIPSGNSTHHHTGNVSLNLNAINLEGLLAVSNHNVVTSLQQQPTYVTSTALVNSSNTIPNSMGLNSASLNTLNILRLSNNASTVTLQPQQVLRQNAVSVMSPASQQGTTMLSMNPSGTTGILLNNSHNNVTTVGSPARLQQVMRQVQQQQQPPQLEEIPVPDLNALLSNGCGTNRPYGRSSTKVPSIDLNLNVNLSLSGAPTSSRPVGAHASTMVDMYSNGTQNGSSSVDSIFNALSEAIGPDLDHKMESTLGRSSPHVSSSLSPSTNSIPQKATVLTLNDLLGSPPMSAAGGSLPMNHVVSSPKQSPQSPSITSLLSPISPNVVTSSIAYTTPRLSALLAGTPSADSSNNIQLVETGIARGGIGSANYGNLLDRLMSQGQAAAVTTGQQRPGGSRLNPIATATPSVALDHPVLAATLTQGTNPNLRQALTRPTTYRQIAPAPPPSLQPVVPSQQQQQVQQHQQQQQLINNLLGLVGTGNPGNPASQAQAIRISTVNSHSSTGTGSSGSR